MSTIRTLYRLVLRKKVSSTILKVFGMTRPGIEPRSPGPISRLIVVYYNQLKTWHTKLILNGPRNPWNQWSLSVTILYDETVASIEDGVMDFNQLFIVLSVIFKIFIIEKDVWRKPDSMKRSFNCILDCYLLYCQIEPFKSYHNLVKMYCFCWVIYIYIYIYIYIVIHRQTVSVYHNSSVWLDTYDTWSWDRSPHNFTLYLESYRLACKRTTSALEL